MFDVQRHIVDHGQRTILLGQALQLNGSHANPPLRPTPCRLSAAFMALV
jgi:hypothetical protein